MVRTLLSNNYLYYVAKSYNLDNDPTTVTLSTATDTGMGGGSGKLIIMTTTVRLYT